MELSPVAKQTGADRFSFATAIVSRSGSGRHPNRERDILEADRDPSSSPSPLPETHLTATSYDAYSYPARGNSPAQGYRLTRVTDAGGAGLGLSVRTAAGSMQQLSRVIVSFSAPVTLSAIVHLRSGIDAAFDEIVETMAFTSDAKGTFRPLTPFVSSNDGAYFEVVVPAPGGVIVAKVLLETVPPGTGM